MLLAVVLLLCNSVQSKVIKTSKNHCSKLLLTCQPMEERICVRMKENKQKSTETLNLNKCELQYMECTMGTKATIVPMKNCVLRSSESEVSDDKRRKLGFLIDLSNNSTTQLPLVIKAIKLVADEAVRYNTPTFMLYTFPEYYAYEVTTDITTFKRQLDQLALVDMKSCEKNIFNHILKATENEDLFGMDKNSYFYVFTNGWETDSKLVYDLDVKRAKITFILLPGCYDRTIRHNAKFEAFFPAASNWHGQLIRIRGEKAILTFAKYVQYTALEFGSELFLSEIHVSSDPDKITVPKDVVYVVVSVTGSNVDFSIQDDLENRVVPEFIYNIAHTKVYRFIALPPFNYTVKLEKSLYKFGEKMSVVNVQFSRIDFSFRYRFSKRQKWRENIDINNGNGEEGGEVVGERHKKPKYLIINVSEERQLVDVNKIKFIDTDEEGNEKEFESHTLIKIDDNVYATEYKIGVPEHEIIMVVSGILKGSVREIDSRRFKYNPKDHENEQSSEESMESGETSVPPKELTTTTETTKTTVTFPTTTCSMFPEALKMGGVKCGDILTKLNLNQWRQYRRPCPEQCPVRDVMVCARCEHGVSRTFMSDCHMRMYQCQHPEDKLHLLARKPCVGSAPYLVDLPRPITSLGEPTDHDPVMSHIDAKQG